MVSAVKKQVDVVRLMADLTAAKVELLSAQCATDRLRLQYNAQDIVVHAERQALKRAIASADSLHRYYSQLEAQMQQQEGSGDESR